MNTLNEMIKLDANELAYPLSETRVKKLLEDMDLKTLNRYPDADSTELIKAYSTYIDIPQNQIIAGNGSDEILDLIYKAFTTPKDIVVSLDPSFVMYEIMSEIYNCEFRKYQPEAYFDLNTSNFIDYLDILKPQLVFICNPNNPTGSLIKPKELIEIIKSTEAYVVVDEAYGEFICDEFMDYSMLKMVNELPNLIVLKTLSKAYGLAGLRIGFGISNMENMEKLYKCKYPYNVSRLSQALGIALMKSDFTETVNYNRLQIIKTREKLISELKRFELLDVYDSFGNFVFFKLNSAQISRNCFIDAFVAKNIQIRQYKQDYLSHYFRITVGTDQEMDQVLRCLETTLTLKKAVGE